MAAVKEWITVNGQHVPIFEGQSKQEAVNNAIKNQQNVEKGEDTKERQIAANKEEGDKKNAEENDMFKRDKFFDKTIYDKLPKKMQLKNIVSIGKHKDSDGVRYNASVKWEDGFNRSVSEYGWVDFKDYLQTVLLKDRNYQQ